MVSALPTIVSHLHDYFVHVAAILEMLHNQVSQGSGPDVRSTPT
jgi:hypothetical protein